MASICNWQKAISLPNYPEGLATQGGALLVFSPDPRRRMTRRLQLADARDGPRAGPAVPSLSKTLKFDA